MGPTPAALAPLALAAGLALLAFPARAADAPAKDPGPAGGEVPCAPVKPCDVGEEGAVGEAEAPADLTAEAKALFAVVSCAGAPPAGLDAATVSAFCREQSRELAAYRDGVLPRVAARLAAARPASGLPSTVVHPYGAELLGALTAYPDARNVTTLAPEGAGDPRGLARLGGSPRELARSLDALRASTRALLAGAPPAAAAKAPRGELPERLAGFLTALAVLGYEPVSLRFFRVQPDGTLHYLTPSELAAAEPAGAGAKGGKAPAGASPAFASSELVFVKRGGDPRKDARVHRHVAADLSDAALARAPGIAKHLEAKGRFAVRTTVAGDRLGRPDHARLRALLLARMTFMISDSAGLPAAAAQQAGFVQETVAKDAPRLVVTRRP